MRWLRELKLGNEYEFEFPFQKKMNLYLSSKKTILNLLSETKSIYLEQMVFIVRAK